MVKITATIDGIHGDIKIAIVEADDKQTVELKWCVFDDNGSTGFLTSFSEGPIFVTELAAEQFLRMVIGSLVKTFEAKPGDLTIVNHMGESLPDVQFLPPTFQGSEADLILFTSQQGDLLNVYSVYENSGELNMGIISLAEEDGIVDDFLSLVQVRASGISLAVRKPSQ